MHNVEFYAIGVFLKNFICNVGSASETALYYRDVISSLIVEATNRKSTNDWFF